MATGASLVLGGCTPTTTAAPAPPRPSAAEPEPGPAPEPPATGEAPESGSGRLAPEVIKKVVRANNAKFRACYQEGLKKDPTLRGRVVTRFVIGPDGHVESAATSGDLKDDDVKECVARATKALSFAKPEGGQVAVAYPIVFSPESGGPEDGPDASAGSGRIPPAVIQKQIRENFAAFRHCYEEGLKKDPELHGRVTIRFVIGLDGKVQSASGEGDIPDEKVIDCVARAMRKIAFPAPEGGIVSVAYPIVFKPDAK